MSSLDIFNSSSADHLYDTILSAGHCLYSEKSLRHKTNKIVHIVLIKLSLLTLTDGQLVSVICCMLTQWHSVESEQTLF